MPATEVEAAEASTSLATGSPSAGLGPLVNEQYRITKRLGGGSFGDIYLGVGQNGERVAVKFEKHSTRCPQLRHEYKVYRELQNCPGFGRVYYFGTHNNYNAMVMDLLGPSLEDLFTKCGRRFGLRTVLQLADQMLERMEGMHARHLIHRDVKPANFVLGPSRGCQTVFCIDFGLSTRYRHPRTLQHIPYREGRSLTGTPRYASINNHLGLEQSRRDDLESIGYVLVYFLKGSLPWQGLKARNAKRKYKMILDKKQQISIQQLCQGLPQQFAEYLAYTRSLKFEAKPNISYLRGLFRELYKAQGYASGAPAVATPTDAGAAASSSSQHLEWDWTKYECANPASGSSVATADAADVSGLITPMDTPPPPAVAERKGASAIAAVEVAAAAAGYRPDTAGAVGMGGAHHLSAEVPGTARTSSAAEAKDAGTGRPPAATGGAAPAAAGKGAPRSALGSEHKAEPRGSAPAGGAAVGRAATGTSATAGGGWSMWNLRPKTSGGFWGGGVRGWAAARETPAQAATPKTAAAAGAIGGAVTSKGARPHTMHLGRASADDAAAAAAAGGAASTAVEGGPRGVVRLREESCGVPGGSTGPGHSLKGSQDQDSYGQRGSGVRQSTRTGTLATSGGGGASSGGGGGWGRMGSNASGGGGPGGGYTSGATGAPGATLGSAMTRGTSAQSPYGSGRSR